MKGLCLLALCNLLIDSGLQVFYLWLLTAEGQRELKMRGVYSLMHIQALSANENDAFISHRTTRNKKLEI